VTAQEAKAVTLDDIADDPDRVQELSPANVTALIGQCAMVVTALLTRVASLQARPTREAPPCDALLTVPDVATLLKLKPAYVYELVRRGSLPAIHSGKYVRVSRSALMAWLKQNGAIHGP
jgi:excisionase family DNA binding protein